MYWRLYLAPQNGDGTFDSPYRSRLNDYVDVHAGEGFDEFDHPAYHWSLCCVGASEATHAAIIADAQVKPATPELSTTKAALVTLLSQPLSDLPPAWVGNAKTFLESKGVDTSQAAGNTTLKQVLQHLVKTFAMSQQPSPVEVKTFLGTHLDTLAVDVPGRQVMASWLANRGIDLSWVTAATTVREIVRYAANNGAFASRFAGVID